MSEERSLAVANAQPPQPLAVANPNDLSAGIAVYWTSMDMAKPGARGRLFTALQNADKGIIDMIGSPIQLADVVAHNILLPNADGTAMVEKTRIVLIDAEGVMYSCVSEGVKKSLQQLFQIVGRPPYDPPLGIIPRQIGTKRGFRTFIFEVTDASLDAAEDKPGKKSKAK